MIIITNENINNYRYLDSTLLNDIKCYLEDNYINKKTRLEFAISEDGSIWHRHIAYDGKYISEWKNYSNN